MDLLSLHLRLSDLNELVSEVFEQAFPGPYWVIAEVAAVTHAPAGHTYLELVEKRCNEIVAQSRAQVWSSRREAVTRFERATHSKLERGMQLLLLAQPTFHKRYGYSLEIRDIDANYTLGDMARRRQDVLDRLTDDGLIDRNRELQLSPVPLRVAVISSRTAAGWEDFQRRLADNSDGYSFAATLFPALMQGNEAERSILAAMAQIMRAKQSFDCVAILRGGGGAVDLSCFDSLEMGRAISKSSLPVICGIGHDRDSSVCDLVSYHAAPTPTAAAEFLIARVRNFETELNSITEVVVRCARAILAREAAQLQSAVYHTITTAQSRIRTETEEMHGLARRGSYAVRTSVAQRTSELKGLEARVELIPRIQLRESAIQLAYLEHDVNLESKRLIEYAGAELNQWERDVRARDPAQVLRRGYSITRANGRMVRDAAKLRRGSVIETTLHRGRITSVVEEAKVKD